MNFNVREYLREFRDKLEQSLLLYITLINNKCILSKKLHPSFSRKHPEPDDTTTNKHEIRFS